MLNNTKLVLYTLIHAIHCVLNEDHNKSWDFPRVLSTVTSKPYKFKGVKVETRSKRSAETVSVSIYHS